MSTLAGPAEQRVVLRSVAWRTYVSLVEESETAGGRMTYDRGVLEIMSPMLPHETAKALLGRMIERFTEIREIDIRSSASTTFQRSDLQRGFEADESYYIQHAVAIRGKEDLDLSIDPPPDLVVEVEMTHSAIDKLGLLAAMGIPEVWRFDGTSIGVGTLQGDAYQPTQQSLVLPGFPLVLAEELLGQRARVSETEIIRRFAQQVT